MPKVKKHHSKLLSDGDTIKISKNINASISSSNMSSSASSVSIGPLKKSQSTIKKISQKQNETSLNNISNADKKKITRPRSLSMLSRNSQIDLNENSDSFIVSDMTDDPSHIDAKDSQRKSSKNRSIKRTNKKFHQLFPSVSINETVIDTYSCAYVKSLNLLHGVMFLTKNYICFYSKILSTENILIIKLQSVISIKKTMHALIFPTAIRIETQNSSYQFTSFRSRSNTLDHLIRLLSNYQQKLHAQSYPRSNGPINEQNSSNLSKTSETTPNSTHTDMVSEEEDYEEKDQDLTSELLSIHGEDLNDTNNNDFNTIHLNSCDTPVTTYFNNFIAYDKKQNNRCTLNGMNKNSVPFIANNCYNYYDIDYSDLSNRRVTVSLRHKQTLIQKVKILIGQLIPAFFDISRIDSLLPICFLMCILLLLNAFVLLNKVSNVDDLFADLLVYTDSVEVVN